MIEGGEAMFFANQDQDILGLTEKYVIVQ